MMFRSDLGLLKETFDRLGISYSEDTVQNECGLGETWVAEIDRVVGLSLPSTSVEFYFNDEGKCVGHGAWD